MTFNLLISDDLKDKLKFSYLEKTILNKGLLSEPKSDKSTIDTIFMNVYKSNKVDLILDMIDEDALVYIA